MVNIIGYGLYGMMSAYAAGGSGRVFPGRLKIVSPDIRVTHWEPAIAGSRGISLEAYADSDNLIIITSGNAIVEDDAAGLKITGNAGRTIYANDYLVSKTEMCADFVDDGLLISYAGNIEFGLEMAMR